MADEGPPEQDAEVIELHGGEQSDGKAPLRVMPPPKKDPYCRHWRTEIDNEARRVYCRDCGREVPLFDVIKALADDFEGYVSSRETAKAQAKRVKQNLGELEHAEKNAKARKRNADRWRTKIIRLIRDGEPPPLKPEAITRLGVVEAFELGYNVARREAARIVSDDEETGEPPRK